MESLSYLNKLDAILNVLKNNYDKLHSIVTYQSMEAKFIGKITMAEIKLIVDKLIKDEYCVIDPNGLHTKAFKVTFEGLVYIGYDNTRKLEEEKLTSIGQMAIATKKYNTRLLWATWCAGIAAFVLLLWQVWIWFYPVNANYPYWIWQTIPKKIK